MASRAEEMQMLSHHHHRRRPKEKFGQKIQPDVKGPRASERIGVNKRNTCGSKHHAAAADARLGGMHAHGDMLLDRSAPLLLPLLLRAAFLAGVALLRSEARAPSSGNSRCLFNEKIAAPSRVIVRSYSSNRPSPCLTCTHLRSSYPCVLACAQGLCWRSESQEEKL